MPKAALIRAYLAQHVPVPSASQDPSEALIGVYEGDVSEAESVDAVVYRR
jgi:hypothetical protein